MNCYNPFWLRDEKILVPCGHCLACRRAKSSEWTTRLMLELPEWKGAIFLTLTYDDEHRPWSLNKKDLQNFFKRLRKEISPNKIKYFACGEYGNKPPLFHAHYHAIVFGLEKNLMTDLLVKRLWTFGFSSIGYVNQKTINYVTGYVMKKYSKEINKIHYENIQRIPPFQLCSRGLGLAYAIANRNDLQRDLSIRLFTGREVPIPRYFVKKLGLEEEISKKSSDSRIKYFNALFRRWNSRQNATGDYLFDIQMNQYRFHLFWSHDSLLRQHLKSTFETKNELFS